MARRRTCNLGGRRRCPSPRPGCARRLGGLTDRPRRGTRAIQFTTGGADSRADPNSAGRPVKSLSNTDSGPGDEPAWPGSRVNDCRSAVSQTQTHQACGASIGQWDNRSHGAVDPSPGWDIVATEAHFGERPPTVPAVRSISLLCATASRRSSRDGWIRVDRRRRLLGGRKVRDGLPWGPCGTGIAVGADGSFSTTVIIRRRVPKPAGMFGRAAWEVPSPHCGDLSHCSPRSRVVGRPPHFSPRWRRGSGGLTSVGNDAGRGP